MGVMAGLLVVVLYSSGANAQSRWIYVGSNQGVAFYVDRLTICNTVSGDLSIFVLAVDKWGSSTERLVIDVESRNYIWADRTYAYWKGIKPESIVELLWAAAYRARYGN